MANTDTYEEIMQDYIFKLGEKFDVREGTLAYIAGSAMAMNLAELYEELQLIEDNAYADTAMGEWLDKVVAIIGLERRGKTNAIVKMQGDSGFVAGDKFKGGEMEYEIVLVESDYYLAKCLTLGSAGNSYIGDVVLVEERSESGEMTIVSIAAIAEDEEDDESLRKRYFERINCPVCTGNLSYYKNVLHSIEGVGGIKVEPVANGIGTVKVIITDPDYSVATDELLVYVKELLDPEETSGYGYGLVPMGHSVTVETVEKVDIEVVCEITGEYAPGYYTRLARRDIPKIFEEMNRKWDEQDNIILWDRIIEDYLFGLGATDVNIVSINGQTNRFKLEPNQILGGFTIDAT